MTYIQFGYFLSQSSETFTKILPLEYFPKQLKKHYELLSEYIAPGCENIKARAIADNDLLIYQAYFGKSALRFKDPESMDMFAKAFPKKS